MRTPPRFSETSVPPGKILWIVITGVAPTVFVLSLSLPFWVKAWIWIPPLAFSLFVAFYKFGNRSVPEIALAILSFRRRPRRRAWRTPRRNIVPKIAVELPREPVHIPFRQMMQTASVFGVMLAVTLVFASGIIFGMKWLVESFFYGEYDEPVPAYAQTTDDGDVIAVRYSPLPTPTSTPIPTLTPMPTPTPSPMPTPVQHQTWTFQDRQWDILVQSGSLVLENQDAQACRVDLSTSSWDYVVSLPELETGKVLVVPALLYPTSGSSLEVSSPCSQLGVELVAYQAYHPQMSRLWFVPVCNPTGNVRVRSNGTVAITVLDPEGRMTDADSVIILRSGAAPQLPSGCWLYRMEADQEVWIEVLTYR